MKRSISLLTTASLILATSFTTSAALSPLQEKNEISHGDGA